MRITKLLVFSIILLLVSLSLSVVLSIYNENAHTYISGAWIGALSSFFFIQAILRAGLFDLCEKREVELQLLINLNNNINNNNINNNNNNNNKQFLHNFKDFIFTCHVIGAISGVILFIVFAVGRHWEAFGLSIFLVVSHVLTCWFIIENPEKKLPTMAPKKRCCNARIASRGINGFLLFFCFIFQILLMVGYGIQAHGTAYYWTEPYRYYNGRFVSITTSDGFSIKIMVSCLGGNSNYSRTIFIDSDASHGLPDFWPLQRELINRGMRVCIYDKPGLGLSDEFFPSQNVLDIENFMPQFILATGETPPFIFIGWGGGSTNIYQYAVKNPLMVSGLVFLDSYGDNVEFRNYQKQNNCTVQEALDYMNSQLYSRYNLFALIRGLGIPFGLISFFLPSDTSSYAFPERWDAYRWPYLNSKSWNTQLKALQQITKETLENPWQEISDIGKNFPKSEELIKKKIAILSIFTNRSAAAECANIGPPGTPACNQALEYREFLTEDVYRLGNLTGNPIFATCSYDECDLGFTLRFPGVIGNNVQKYYSHLSGNI